MEKLIEKLEHHYSSILTTQNEWSFFLALADYAKFVTENPELNNIVNAINKKESLLWEQWQNLYALYVTVFKYDKEVAFLLKDPVKNKQLITDLGRINGKMKEVESRKHTNTYANIDFSKERHMIWVLMVHSYLVKKITEKDDKQTKETKKQTLCLDKNGNLYGELRDKDIYSMEKNSDRHKIVRYFVENKISEYYPTQEIANELKGGNTTSLMKEIGSINGMAMGRIKLKNKIIEGKKDSGYRISSRYKIIAKK